jgi:hypothetical protein
MADLPAISPDAMLPAPFGVSAADPDFPPRPAPDGDHGTARPGLQSLGFAPAPVPVDYAPPQAPDFTVPSRAAGLLLSADTVPDSAARAESPAAGPVSAGHVTADPGYIWDLAATDVFPAAADPATEAPGAVPEDGDPGAS